MDEVTPVEDGFQYDDGDTTLILAPINESTVELEISEGEQVLSGQSGDKAWTSVTDVFLVRKASSILYAEVPGKPDQYEARFEYDNEFGDQLVMSYGLYDNAGSFREEGRYIFDTVSPPAEADNQHNYIRSFQSSGAVYKTIPEIYDLWPY